MNLDYVRSTLFSASDNFQSDRASTTNFRGSSCESLQNLLRFAIQFAGLLKVFHLRLTSYTSYSSVTIIYVNYLFSVYVYGLQGQFCFSVKSGCKHVNQI